MRWFVWICLFVLVGAGTAQAQLIKTYGDDGAWSVLLEKDSHGDEFCLASSWLPPAGPGSYNLSFAVDQNYNRLFLGYLGPEIPTPASIRLVVEGKDVADLPVDNAQASFAGDVHLLVIDLPPNLLRALVFPAMAQDSAVTADAGAAKFTVPTAGFRAIRSEVDDCSVRERKDDASI
jgi:hypothetical protein